MPQEKFTTTLVPFETKPIHTGTGAAGQPYTIYQVRARNLAGQEIVNYPLRSFEQLRLHEPVEVECQLFNGGERYGYSYTLKAKAKAKAGTASEARVEHLERQMVAVFERLGMEYLPAPAEQAAAASSAPTPAPSAPPPAPAPVPPPAPAAPISAPPQIPPVPPTQVASSQPVQPEPPGGYGSHNQYGGDEDIPF